jgi:DNA ligase-1
MKAFAHLIHQLNSSTKTNDKLKALSDYFTVADDKDKVWVIALFSGRRPKRAVTSTQLKTWCMEYIQLQPWLFEECYHTVGDLAETIALLLAAHKHTSTQNFPLYHYIETLISIKKESETAKKEYILQSWQQLSQDEIFVFNKLITGSFRIGVSQKLIVNALAKTNKLSPSIITHRISGKWNPATTTFTDLLSEDINNSDASKPYPFYLAYALEDELSSLGNENEWQAEWKWDGIRGQIIKRNNELFVWSRGEELMTDRFPEYQIFSNLLHNGIVLDGEIICLQMNADGSFRPLPFTLLQTRIGRKNISKKELNNSPVGFIAYDILECNGEDIRHKALTVRRNLLEELLHAIQYPSLQISPLIAFHNWNALAIQQQNARAFDAEGVMLKRKNSEYQVGRKTGDWWKWKVEPLTIDAVMIYAQKGHGRRSNLYTDYTFAVKDGDKLVPFTKAYSGLTDKEFAQVDAFVKKNAIEKFGPVRTVKPELVFEIAFEGIAASNRHKSGVALRFPRIKRWRQDKKADEINTLQDLQQLLEQFGK